jgi:transposase
MVAASWDGFAVPEIAGLVGCHARTVRSWIHRFNAEGVDGLGDRQRPGRPRRLTE